MRLLEKLAAWYLRDRATGIVFNTPVAAPPLPTDMRGWIYGNGWHINFPRLS